MNLTHVYTSTEEPFNEAFKLALLEFKEKHPDKFNPKAKYLFHLVERENTFMLFEAEEE